MERTQNMRSLMLSLAILAMFLILQPTGVHAQGSIKVGILDTYSGPPAVYGNDALNGFKLALNDINKNGVLGKKIEFTTRDDKFKVDIGLSMAKELVMMEKVDLIVGTINAAAGSARVAAASVQPEPGGPHAGRAAGAGRPVRAFELYRRSPSETS